MLKLPMREHPAYKWELTPRKWRRAARERVYKDRRGSGAEPEGMPAYRMRKRAGQANKESSRQGNNRILSRLSQEITEARRSGSRGRSPPEGHSQMRGQDLGKGCWAFEEQFHWTWGRVTSQVSTPGVKEGLMAA